VLRIDFVRKYAYAQIGPLIYAFTRPPIKIYRGLAYFMPYFPAGTSFFAAHFASSSRFSHSFLQKQLKIFIVKGFQTFEIYGIIKQ